MSAEARPRRRRRSRPAGVSPGLLVVGVAVGVGIGVGLFVLLERRRGPAQPMLQETRVKRDDDGFVTASQTVTMPVGVGSNGLAPAPQLGPPEGEDGG